MGGGGRVRPCDAQPRRRSLWSPLQLEGVGSGPRRPAAGPAGRQFLSISLPSFFPSASVSRSSPLLAKPLARSFSVSVSCCRSVSVSFLVPGQLSLPVSALTSPSPSPPHLCSLPVPPLSPCCFSWVSLAGSNAECQLLPPSLSPPSLPGLLAHPGFFISSLCPASPPLLSPAAPGLPPAFPWRLPPSPLPRTGLCLSSLCPLPRPTSLSHLPSPHTQVSATLSLPSIAQWTWVRDHLSHHTQWGQDLRATADKSSRLSGVASGIYSGLRLWG